MGRRVKTEKTRTSDSNRYVFLVNTSNHRLIKVSMYEIIKKENRQSMWL